MNAIWRQRLECRSQVVLFLHQSRSYPNAVDGIGCVSRAEFFRYASEQFAVVVAGRGDRLVSLRLLYLFEPLNKIENPVLNLKHERRLSRGFYPPVDGCIPWPRASSLVGYLEVIRET